MILKATVTENETGEVVAIVVTDGKTTQFLTPDGREDPNEYGRSAIRRYLSEFGGRNAEDWKIPYSERLLKALLSGNKTSSDEIMSVDVQRID